MRSREQLHVVEFGQDNPLVAEILRRHPGWLVPAASESEDARQLEARPGFLPWEGVLRRLLGGVELGLPPEQPSDDGAEGLFER